MSDFPQVAVMEIVYFTGCKYVLVIINVIWNTGELLQHSWTIVDFT